MNIHKPSYMTKAILLCAKFACVVATTMALFFTQTAAEAIPPLPLRCDAPEWLNESIRGSMGAVWRELQVSRLTRQSAVNALALVASRLFPGYDISLAGRYVVIKPERIWQWQVEIAFPEVADRLVGNGLDWLETDIRNAIPELEKVMETIPPEALGWSSGKFHSKISSIISENIPGWRCAAKISTDDEQKAFLKINIYPENPLLLAVSPETLSSSISQLLADKISDKTVEFMSPFTGLPLAWVDYHKNELNDWLSKKQLDNSWLEALRASAKNDINLKPIAKVTTQIESTTFSLRGWVSAHAGSSARLEAGAHIGHFFTFPYDMPAEVYDELIIGFEDWDLDNRLGLRFSPYDPVWLGAEWSRKGDDHFWLRLWITPERSDLYAWLRYGDEDSVETAVGYHLNRYVSLELYYDSREEDEFSIRALSNL